MGKFTDKYHLNKSQSLFLAKKGQIKNIYCGMKIGLLLWIRPELS